METSDMSIMCRIYNFDTAESYCRVEYDERWIITPLVNDFLALEIASVGLSEALAEDFYQNDVKPGFYWVRFFLEEDVEYGEFGSILSRAVAPVGIAEIRPSLVARVLPVGAFFSELLRYGIDLLTPRWHVDFEYGGVGTSTEADYLPVALWIRFIRPKSFAPWGADYSDVSIRR